jgi:hypothetical protein
VWRRGAGAGAAVALVLGAIGLGLDRSDAVAQAALFGSILGASLLGAALGLGLGLGRVSAPRRLGLGVASLVAWRISYFPIMVFSGHVASIGEWILLGSRVLPVLVYPVFLVSVASLHAVAGLAASWLVDPGPGRRQEGLLATAAIPAFAVAVLVSFSTLRDVALLPDTSLSIAAPVPIARQPESNPYLPSITAPGYALPQRVMLVAAGLTYATIPDSPWARTVKGVLEGLFLAKPIASTRDRVEEHYLAYHSAHAFIGCRSVEACPR